MLKISLYLLLSLMTITLCSAQSNKSVFRDSAMIKTLWGTKKGFLFHDKYFVRITKDTAYLFHFVYRSAVVSQDFCDTMLLQENKQYIGKDFSFQSESGAYKLFSRYWNKGKKYITLTQKDGLHWWRYYNNQFFLQRMNLTTLTKEEQSRLIDSLVLKDPEEFKKMFNDIKKEK